MPRLIALLIAVFVLTACHEERMPTGSPEAASFPVAVPSNAETGLTAPDHSAPPVKAVYFAPEGDGEIASADLEQHPEIKVVHTFSELKKASGGGNAIWIDKDAAKQVDRAWLQSLPQRSNPIVLVGYHNALYAFRETLDAFGIEGPKVDWSNVRVVPGFSVWQWRTFTPSTKSAWQKGFDEPSTVEHILAITDPLLEGKNPLAQAAPFDEHQAVEAVLADHPEYPQAGETVHIETITGGPAPGSKVTGTLTTTVDASSEPETYIVTLTKRWNLIFNDKRLIGYWTYKVNPQTVQLIESEDNTDLVQMVK